MTFFQSLSTYTQRQVLLSDIYSKYMHFGGNCTSYSRFIIQYFHLLNVTISI